MGRVVARIDEALAWIADALARLDQRPPSPVSSGTRAALWRAQHEAARPGADLDDLRSYCVGWLARPRLLEAEHENGYLRGYREGLQLVLREIRRIEIARGR